MYFILAKILSFPFLIPNTFAAGTGPGTTIPTQPNTPIGGVTFTGPFGNATITSVLNNIANYAVIIAAPLSTVMVIYGAFQILTAQGKAPQITAGKTTIKYALGGLVVVVVARLLVSIVSGIAKGLIV